MTAVTLHLSTPTHAERRLLRLAARLTAFIERRVRRRAERRMLELDLLRQEQTRRHSARETDYLLAQQGLAGR